MKAHSALLAVGFALLFSAPAFSGAATIIPRGDHADALVIPAGSSLHFRAFDQEGTAKFDGAIEMSGTYYFGSNPVDDGEAPQLTLYLVPDKATLARLPHFKERGAPNGIYLSNEDAFAKAVIPAEKLKGLNKRGAKYASGKIDIWADKFEAGIECDAPYFNAHFLSVVQPPLRVALADLPDVGC